MTVEEEVTAKKLEEDIDKLKNLAVEKQQCFYELLPDCTIYEFAEHKYLKQNIGYALYGPPTKNEDATNTAENSGQLCYVKENSNDEAADITDAIDYDTKAKKIINKIYKKIRECASTDRLEPIYFGVIYNVIICPNTKTKFTMKKKLNGTGGNETKVEEEKLLVLPVPVFKIRKKLQRFDVASSEKKQEDTSIKIEADYETWYIDTSARVYKSWSDYIRNNNLPECFMVLPKDGFYQPDPCCPIGENYSTVWVEGMYFASLSKKIILIGDLVSNIFLLISAGLFIASKFVSLISLLILDAVLLIMGCAWRIGRIVYLMVDCCRHKEPVYMITTYTYVTKTYNAGQDRILLCNNWGHPYVSYMAEECKLGQTFSYRLNALSLATYIMFFAGSVVNIQFAGDIIETTQGRVIDDFKNSLRNENLRKKFNHTVRKAAENNTCKIAENTEVIRYIRNHQELLSVNQSAAGSKTSGRTSGRASDSVSNKSSDETSNRASNNTSGSSSM